MTDGGSTRRSPCPPLPAGDDSPQQAPHAAAERWQTLIPHARVEVIGDAGHMLPYEQPDKLVRAVTAFLQQTR